ncbi:uncharacterized protein LOC112453602 [Temnothorax curvispinosus]|uniref:Uncharacterized protein LOC112453602 n=1 Tax=Temnothorax curvispinosus TaxID=300111 RepID=A0A6J1PLJ7_9HYME|nr:uncharacterized protein LOC112453602 [Temnothorax curvispinosus]
MGKSMHKSRKRRRSSSSKHRDRIEGLENKISQLIEVLSRREVGCPHVESLSPTVSSALACHTDQESDAERPSDDIIREDSPGRAKSASQVAEMANPARQVRPEDPHVTAAVSNLPDDGLPTSPPSKTIVLSEPAAAEDSADTLTRELFGAIGQIAETQSWNDLVVQQLRELMRKGLPADQREALLKKYSPPEEGELDFLKAPKLNIECKSALKNNAVVKRDEYGSVNHHQVGSALLAFGEALSDLLKPETQSSLNAEARAAIDGLLSSRHLILWPRTQPMPFR